MNLTGYADPMVAKGGDRVEFMISGDEGNVQLSLVRLIHGDTDPAGPGFVEEVVLCDVPPTCAISPQHTRFGSFACVPGSVRLIDNLTAATTYAFIQPTRPGQGTQTILSCIDEVDRSGFAFGLDGDGFLQFKWGQNGAIHEVRQDKALVAHCWYFVAASWDFESGSLALHQFAVINQTNSRIGPVVGYDLNQSTFFDTAVQPQASRHDFVLAGSPDGNGWATRLFDGKIDRPGVQLRAMSSSELQTLSRGETPDLAEALARWDTSAGYTASGIGDVIEDSSSNHLHAIGINRPVRGMTGWNWDGTAESFRLDTSQYGGIAFHSDALIDCQWTSSVSLELPTTLRSGAYALRVRQGDLEDHIPFFVSPREPRGRIAVLLSTFTYLAYANECLPIGSELMTGVPLVLSEDGAHARAAREHGLSTYDSHIDGSGVCFSSWRRPIRNMRPQFRMDHLGTTWAFPADLSLIWWLENEGMDYEVITDHDLDSKGSIALESFSAVITSTHPEYYSTSMLDGIETYIHQGGKLLYLGGNGFYWVTETRPDEPHCIEIRRLNTGIRAWEGRPGEGYLITTGQKSGLWRDRGRPPQKIVGVGFTTEGMDVSQPFTRLSDSYDPEMAWIFEGLQDDELIGDFGLGRGGASGLEMDRYDLALGTPPHTRLLCASFGHSDAYPLVPEDIMMMLPGYGGTQNPLVRGDVTYFTTAKGGAVFSAGSIAWSQALPANGGDNNVATITRNILRAFVDTHKQAHSSA
jgi:N,N-dimethylformamidase